MTEFVDAWDAQGRVHKMEIPVHGFALVEYMPGWTPPATVAANNGGLPETAGRVSARPAFSGDPSEAAE